MTNIVLSIPILISLHTNWITIKTERIEHQIGTIETNQFIRVQHTNDSGIVVMWEKNLGITTSTNELRREVITVLQLPQLQITPLPYSERNITNANLPPIP